ncbi:O-antigen ligase [Deinococcus yavapaiensis KR-236]|uniref:O-antigen ligase n=2 Tax=Deinococcus TaxID=1298 RepID=A0A318S5Z8_9DEIO|nr:O-antigen ligase [Deinococcus yavapaiensis KR-236]
MEHSPVGIALSSSLPPVRRHVSLPARLIWLRDFLWPAFILLYPLLTPNGGDFATSVTIHSTWAILCSLLGAIFELLARPATQLRDIVLLPRWLWSHKPVLMAWLLGLWVIISSSQAQDRAAAFAGSGFDFTDSASWVLSLIAVFTLVYIRALADEKLKQRCVNALIVSTLILALGGIVEVVMGRGIFLNAGEQTNLLPIVNFPQKGHLAGWLVVGCAAALASRQRWALFAMLPIACTIALTGNRAALVAIGLVAVATLIMHSQKRAQVVKVGALVLTFLLGMGVSRMHQGKETRQLQDTSSMSSRTMLWTAGGRGVMERPIFGWGGGQFYSHWTDQLTDGELKTFLRFEFNEKFAYRKDGMVYRVTQDGHVRPRIWIGWKAHNQILDFAIMYGLPGAAILVGLMVLALLNVRNLEVWAAFAAYSVFMLLWFPIPWSEGALWALWGLASAVGPRKRTLSETI